jgi:hypothetical protein
MVQHYRSAKSSLVRGQTLIGIVAGLFIVAGFYATSVARYAGGPDFNNLISSAILVIALVGLRKKFFPSITPVKETATSPTPIRYHLREGHSYLAHDSNASFEAFSDLVHSGYEGLMITRIFPQDVRNDYALQTTPIRWLAEESSEDQIPPGDLLAISLMVKDFLKKATKPVVMLHGIEYLTTNNGFTPTLRLIHGLIEASAATRGILILPIVPDSLNKQDEALLVAETTALPMPSES